MTLLKVLTAAATLAALPAHAATVVYSVDHFDKLVSNTGIIDTVGMLGVVNFVGPRGGSVDSSNPFTIVTVKNVVFLPTFAGSGPENGTFLYGDPSGHIYKTSITWAVNSAGVSSAVESGVSYSPGSDLYALVYDGVHTSSNDVPLTITLGGLTIGKPYELQAIFTADNGGGNGNDRLLFLPGNTPPSDHPDGGTTNGNADLAYGPTSGPGLLKGSFIADSTSQTFTFSNIDQDNERVSLAAIILTVPEASSSALVILGAAVGLTRRRR